MNGTYEEKFPQARALYMYMYAHPGKKLNFMGNEIGHFRDWDEKREQDWNLLDYPAHQSFHQFMTDLNHLYLEHPAFYEQDFETEGFQWLDCHQEESCIYAFERLSKKERLIAVFNFSGSEQTGYRLTVPGAEKLKPLLSSDWTCYGGSVEKADEAAVLEKGECILALKPFSAVYYLAETKKTS